MRGMRAVRSLMIGSSSPAAMRGCAVMVCSTMVVPERGKPTMKTGCGTSERTPARGRILRRVAAKNALAERQLLGIGGEIGLAAQFAKDALSLAIGDEG